MGVKHHNSKETVDIVCSRFFFNLGRVRMNTGQLLPDQGQVDDPGINFVSVYGLTSVTVNMSFSLPWGNFEMHLLAVLTFLYVNRTQKLPQGKSSLVHAQY